MIRTGESYFVKYYNRLGELQNLQPLTCEQAELILQAALAPTIARKAEQGEFVTCFDHFDLLQTAIN